MSDTPRAQDAPERPAVFAEPRPPDPYAAVWRDRAIVLAITILLFIPLLGSFGLWDPWETHYGEVARQITERHDWISTWWGSHWKNGQGGQEGTYFYSKPILLMWLMAMGMEVFGFSEWGIRLGVAIIAIVGVVVAFVMGEKVFGRRAGYLMALVLATSPFYFMLSRQAQTDMPFVGNMTIGLCFFVMGLFGRDRDAAPTRLSYGLLLGTTFALAVPQLILVGVGLSGWRQGGNVGPVEAFFVWGPTEAVIYGALLVLVTVTLLRSRHKRNGQLYMLAFYVFLGLATLSKGLLGFLLPGAFIFFYLLLTGQWRRLAEMELLRGVGLFIAIAFPWYVAMLVRHGNAYYERFFVHDHFKRLSTGVHQIDSGSFEHYIKWLGYGLWPWGSFLPAAIARLFAGNRDDRKDDQQHAILFLVIWAAFTFTLFTLSSTKFHHYCFPAVPAMAFLIALTLDDLWTARLRSTTPMAWVLWLLALGLLALVGWDLVDDPEHLKNLFTYKYDRKWDANWTGPMQVATGVIFAAAMAGALPLLSRNTPVRRVGIGLLAAASIAMTVYGLDYYMPAISPTWSQKGIWDAYYGMCTRTDGPPGHDAKKRYCAEQVLSYKLNWRGETYYTQNEVLPIREDEEFDYFLKNNGDRTFYAVMEYSRFNGEFTRKLPDAFKGKACKVYQDNIKFVLAKAPCTEEERARSNARPQLPTSAPEPPLPP